MAIRTLILTLMILIGLMVGCQQQPVRSETTLAVADDD